MDKRALSAFALLTVFLLAACTDAPRPVYHPASRAYICGHYRPMAVKTLHLAGEGKIGDSYTYRFQSDLGRWERSVNDPLKTGLMNSESDLEVMNAEGGSPVYENFFTRDIYQVVSDCRGR